jgi:hypothetical protein
MLVYPPMTTLAPSTVSARWVTFADSSAVSLSSYTLSSSRRPPAPPLALMVFTASCAVFTIWLATAAFPLVNGARYPITSGAPEEPAPVPVPVLEPQAATATTATRPIAVARRSVIGFTAIPFRTGRGPWGSGEFT